MVKYNILIKPVKGKEGYEKIIAFCKICNKVVSVAECNPVTFSFWLTRVLDELLEHFKKNHPEEKESIGKLEEEADIADAWFYLDFYST